MKYSLNVCLVLLLCVYSLKYHIGNLIMCNKKKPYPIMMESAHRMVGEDQELNWKFLLSRPFDNDNTYTIDMSRIMKNNATRHLAQIGKVGACKGMTDWGGKIYEDAAAAAGVKNPTECPIPTKDYHLNWYRLNWEDVPIVKMVPKGKFLVKIEITDLKKVVVTCCKVVFEKF